MKLKDILENAQNKVLGTINESAIEFEIDKDSLFEGVEIDEDVLDAVVESLSLYAKEGMKTMAKELASSIVESMEEDLTAFEDTVIEESQTKVLENLDFLVNKTSTEWIAENEEAVIGQTKAYLYESAMKDLATLFSNHNINLDDERVDVYDRMVQESEETKAFANSLADENKVLREEKDALLRKDIMKELTEGMADTSKEKFESLVEGLSTERLQEKGHSLKEVFVPKDKIVISKTDGDIITEAKQEGDGVKSKQKPKDKDTKKVFI